ncbi:MAG: galactokinase [Acidobacteria bacterium]|nr:galactokinase [Candidatus Sulfomarinibacter kjeldsenii]
MTPRAAAVFREYLGDPTGAVVARAPGRVNLIGEHTDYNDGFVLPSTIDRHVEVVARLRSDRKVRIVAADLGERRENHLDEPIDYTDSGWLPYVLGVVHELAQRGRIEFGVDIVFRGTVPRGAGLSSSAALEVATALALDAIFNLWLNPIDMAKLCRDVEHRYAGVRCGIMDQFASRLGQSGHALLIDCRSLDARHVPMPLDNHRLVIVDSGVRRELADSAYNQRRKECEEAVAILREAENSITSLRDLTLDTLAKHENVLPPDLFSRCRHVVSENHRVLEACESLAGRDLPAFGRLMIASHFSLRNDFEVSHPALDRLVEEAIQVEGVLGARLTGAGFGGCTVNLVTETALPDIERQLEPLIEDWSAQSLVIGVPEKAGVTEVIA